jgi:hypothetical protein
MIVTVTATKEEDLAIQFARMASRNELVKGVTLLQITDNRGAHDYGVFDKCTDDKLCYRRPTEQVDSGYCIMELVAIKDVTILSPLMLAGYLNKMKLQVPHAHNVVAELKTFDQYVSLRRWL